MALRSKRKVSASGVPAELLDEDHLCWEGRLSSHRQAVEAFAIEQEWVRFYGDNTRPFADLNQIREAGIPFYSCARLQGERHPDLEVNDLKE